ncbi:MAG: hypothetical protein QXN23_05790 [Candidatus Caldarchaeum sp.]
MSSEWIEAVERVKPRAYELAKRVGVSLRGYEKIFTGSDVSEGVKIGAALSFLKEYHLLEHLVGNLPDKLDNGPKQSTKSVGGQPVPNTVAQSIKPMRRWVRLGERGG